MRGLKNTTNLLLRDRQRDRQRQSERDIETERGTERDSDRQTERQKNTKKKCLEFNMKESDFFRKGRGRMDMFVFFFFLTFIAGKIDTFVAVEIDSQLKAPSRFCDWRSKCCRCKVNGFG